MDVERPRHAEVSVDFSKMADWIKLAPRYVFALCLATGLLLFGKPSWLLTLGLHSFVDKQRAWIGIIFIVGASLLLAHAGVTLINRIWKWWNRKQRIKHGQKRLQCLTSEETEILIGYLGKGTRSQYLSMASGVVSGLVSEGIIYRSVNLSCTDGISFAYNIQPWAWDYLMENPELIK